MSGGPIALFDKSFLQSLSLDEAVLFDHFFFPVICPLFYVETLADLEKSIREGRTAEQEVGIIARKTPQMSGGPSIHHTQLCWNDLMGTHVPMDGRIPMAGGKSVKHKGETGIVFDQPPELQTFIRWQKGDFHYVEREFAKEWRSALSSLDLTAFHDGLGIHARNCKSLEEARRMAYEVVSGRSQPFERMKLACLTLGIPDGAARSIIARWEILGCPSLFDYAPYAAHVVSVEVFFRIALAANLISAARVSTRMDIAYLFYVPFCQVFLSSDRLHERCAPHFLRSDQWFIWGEDLKENLKKLVDYYKGMPERELEKGLMSLAPHPPIDKESLVGQIWDRCFDPQWRDIAKKGFVESDPLRSQALVEHLKGFTGAQARERQEETEGPFDLETVDVVSVQRKVQKKRGSWWQLPKDLKEDSDPGEAG